MVRDKRVADLGMKIEEVTWGLQDGQGPQHRHIFLEAKSLNFKPWPSILYSVTTIFIIGYLLNPLLLKTHIILLLKKKI